VTERNPLFRPGWVVALAPAVLSVVAAFYLGSARGEDLPTPDFNFADKVGHFLAFGFVQLTHTRAIRFLLEPSRHPGHLFVAAGFASAWGGLLEIWQMFLPYRTAEWADFIADSAGALTFAWVHWAWARTEFGKDA
jgi:VanZ family protein